MNQEWRADIAPVFIPYYFYGISQLVAEAAHPAASGGVVL
jgi:hypothetical protein